MPQTYPHACGVNDAQTREAREACRRAETVLEAGRSGDAIFDQRLAPIVPFLDQRLAHAEAVTLDGGAAVGTSADLRKARDLLSNLLGFLSGAAFRRDIFT